MSRKVDDNGKRLEVAECPLHGEYTQDAPDSPCPSCEDAEEEDDDEE